MMTKAEQHAQALALQEGRLAMLRLQDRQQLEAQLKAGIHREEGIELLAWCRDPLNCTDVQEPVIGTRITTNTTYRDSGGDQTGPMANLIQNTHVDFEWGSDEDRACQRCGKDRQIGDQVRELYAPVSGFSQEGLLEVMRNWAKTGGRPPMTPGTVFQKALPEDDRVGQLEQELAELRALVGNGNGTPSGGAINPPAAVPAPARGVKGYRKRGERYEALLYRSETDDGKQRSIGAFDTPEEAVAARNAALSEEAA